MSLSRAGVLAAVVAASLVVASPSLARAEDPPPASPSTAAPAAAPAAPPAGSAATEGTAADRKGQPMRTAGFVSIGVGVVLILAGGVVALSGVSLKHTVDDECPNKVCPASASGDLDTLRGRATAANVFWAAGLVTAASGIGLVLSSGTKSSYDEDKDKGGSTSPRRGAIVVSPAGAGLSARLTF